MLGTRHSAARAPAQLMGSRPFVVASRGADEDRRKLARSPRDIGHMTVAGGYVRLDRRRPSWELLGATCADIHQEQFVLAMIAADEDDPARVQESVGRVAELPLRLTAFRLDQVDRLQLAILDAVEVPPAGPIGHHVQLAVRAPLRLEQRLLRA